MLLLPSDYEEHLPRTTRPGTGNAALAPPAPGRTQLIRTSVDGICEWVVIAVGAVEE
jgi:hypothetical protein